MKQSEGMQMEILLIIAAYMAVAIAPTVLILKRRDEIPQAVLVSVIVAQWLLPIFGWFYAAWVADYDFRDT